MLGMMSEMEFLPQKIVKDLWMSENDLKDLARRGHLVGLHSHDHPTQMSKLSFDEQYYQYKRNFVCLRSMIGDVVSMSHPCGDYNDDTLKIVESLGLKIGFKSSFSAPATERKFEVPRNDHANILREMRNEN
jgi:peptidoglycan/xylan/chitin deacetylase (PgdA/CDA1 family)